MIPFAYRQVKYTCTCTRQVLAVDFVSITSDYQIYVEWHCSCGRHCQVAMPIEHLVETAPPMPLPINAINSFDKEFAKQAHIKLE